MEDHSSDSEKRSKELQVREIVAEWEGWFMCCENSHFVALQRGRYVPGSLYLEDMSLCGDGLYQGKIIGPSDRALELV